jgi:hypothetical protein
VRLQGALLGVDDLVVVTVLLPGGLGLLRGPGPYQISGRMNVRVTALSYSLGPASLIQWSLAIETCRAEVEWTHGHEPD